METVPTTAWDIENYAKAKTWEEFIAGIPYWKLQLVRNFGDYYNWGENGKFT